MVYASPDTAYIQRLKPFLEKKKRLAADEWGADTKVVKHIFDPLQEWLINEVPGIKKRYPPMWTVTHHGMRICPPSVQNDAKLLFSWTCSEEHLA
jgi:hypothetical protein